jgi:hypothetical protein
VDGAPGGFHSLFSFNHLFSLLSIITCLAFANKHSLFFFLSFYLTVKKKTGPSVEPALLVQHPHQRDDVGTARVRAGRTG